MTLTSKAKERIWILGKIAIIIVVIGGIGAIVVWDYWDDIKPYLGYSDDSSSKATKKPTRDRDRGPVVTIGKTVIKKAAMKPAKKKAVKKVTKITPAPVKPATASPDDNPTEPSPTETNPAVKPDSTEPSKNLCAELPFSYEFEKSDPNAKHPLHAKLWGPNYACFLAASHDLSMPGTVPQVRERLEKMSEKRFKRYKTQLEKLIRRAACRTLDYYANTCKQYLDPNHSAYFSRDDVRALLQKPASLHDVTPPDRFRGSHRATRRASVTEPPMPSTKPVKTVKKGSTSGHMRIGLKTRSTRSPRLCGPGVKICPKPY